MRYTCLLVPCDGARLTQNGLRTSLGAGAPERELAADEGLSLPHVEILEEGGVGDLYDLDHQSDIEAEDDYLLMSIPLGCCQP